MIITQTNKQEHARTKKLVLMKSECLWVALTPDPRLMRIEALCQSFHLPISPPKALAQKSKPKQQKREENHSRSTKVCSNICPSVDNFPNTKTRQNAFDRTIVKSKFHPFQNYSKTFDKKNNEYWNIYQLLDLLKTKPLIKTRRYTPPQARTHT